LAFYDRFAADRGQARSYRSRGKHNTFRERT
jgi:hypothetical protein